ncbi:MAG: tyrosine-type recombinase/integrase, partial [Puniceicoccales bacterium]
MSDTSAEPDRVQSPQFLRVAECLYRNTSTGIYYALFKRGGKQIRKSLRTQDRKLAERRLVEFRGKIDRTNPTSESRQIRFEELGEQWLQLHNASLKPSSADRNRRCLKELLRFFQGSRVVDVRRTDCQAWEVQRGAKLNSSTFNKEMEVMKSIFEYGVERGIILDNPAAGMKRRRIRSKPIVIPSQEQFEQLLKGIRKLDGRANEALHLVQLLAYSGMRLGEA